VEDEGSLLTGSDKGTVAHKCNSWTYTDITCFMSNKA